MQILSSWQGVQNILYTKAMSAITDFLQLILNFLVSLATLTINFFISILQLMLSFIQSIVSVGR